MDLSIVILSWNSERYIDKCLQSLLDDLHHGQYIFEVFIVDNGSKDGTRSIIDKYSQQYPEKIKPIYLSYNTGTTYSRNLAIKKTKGEYIIIMDSDVEVYRGAIRELLRVQLSDDSIGLVAPKLIYPSGKLQKSTDTFPTAFRKLFRYFFLRYLEDRENHLVSDTGIREIDYAISAFWILKREVIEKVGLLDENIFYAPEDVDYCLRIWESGYKIVQTLDVTIVHDAQEISRGIRINQTTFKHIQGLLYYFKKHGYFFKKPDRNFIQQTKL